MGTAWKVGTCNVVADHVIFPLMEARLGPYMMYACLASSTMIGQFLIRFFARMVRKFALEGHLIFQ